MANRLTKLLKYHKEEGYYSPVIVYHIVGLHLIIIDSCRHASLASVLLIEYSQIFYNVEYII